MLKTKHIYLALTVLGLILPYTQFVPWLMEHGLNLRLLVSEVTASRIAGFAWLDVIVSALVLLVFMGTDGRKKGIRYLWLPVIGTFLVGVSFGLPLFLYLREP